MEFDGKSSRRPSWVHVHGADVLVILLEGPLVWSPRKEPIIVQGSRICPTHWPALVSLMVNKSSSILQPDAFLHLFCFYTNHTRERAHSLYVQFSEQ